MIPFDCADGEWYWADGSLVDYDNWVKGEPNGDQGQESCTEVYSIYQNDPGGWNDRDCEEDQYLMCKMPKSKMVVLFLFHLVWI